MGGEEKEDEDNDDLEEGEEIVGPQGESVAPMKIVRDPGAPTPGEVEAHNVTHCPFRSCCVTCVEAIGKEDARRDNKAGMDEKPTVQFDYKEFGQSANEVDKIKMLVSKDKGIMMAHAHGVEQKGLGD